MVESITLSINTSLGYISLFCIVVLFGILFHRIIRIFSNALVSAIIRVQYPNENIDNFKSALQRYAHNSLVGYALGFLGTILSVSLQVIVVSLRVIFFILYSLLPVVILIIVLIIINEKWNEFLLFMVRILNESILNTLRIIILFPFEVFDTVGSNILPLFNFLVYTIIQAPLQILFYTMQSDGKDHFMMFLKGIAGAFPLMAKSINSFATINVAECRDFFTTQNGWYVSNDYKLCSNGTYGNNQGSIKCSLLSANEIASSCFDSNTRGIQLYDDGGFIALQQAAGHGIMIVGSTCNALALLANFTLFPLIDPSAWKALDHFSNAILSAFIATPLTTIERCKIAGGLTVRPSMCTPDLGPAFNYLASGSLLIGQALTNWIDMIYLLIFDTNGGSLLSSCKFDTDFKEIFNDEVRKRLMGSNATVMVRMDKHTFSLTDGYSSVFIEQKGPTRRSYVPQNWPIPINQKYGVARTLLPSGNTVKDNGIGLFGCTCETQLVSNNTLSNTQVNIQCAITTRTGNSWIIPVEWSLSSQVQLLTCKRLRIVVQSIRYPQKRVVVSELSKHNKASSFCENCLTGDIAIYVIPVCGDSNVFKSLACLPAEYFTRGVCFPYCMAIHLKNEYTKPLMMRGAAEWEQGVLLANRDCVPFSQISKVPDTVNMDTTNENNMVETTCTIQGEKQTSQVMSYAKVLNSLIQSSTTTTTLCPYSTSCITTIRDKSIFPEYTTALLGSVPIITGNSASNTEGVRLTQDMQPLVVAGGIHMRKYRFRDGGSDDESFLVDFPTLVGNQLNEFTIENHASIGIQVAPKAPVGTFESSYAKQFPGKIYIPQALFYTQVHIPMSPAVLTSDALWYATNPSYDWMYAMINYCSSEGAYTQTQIQILSSYSPMRLWRVQYQNSGCYKTLPDNRRICSPNVSLSYDIDTDRNMPMFTANDTMNSRALLDLCYTKKPMNLWVESMEEFDEYNLVIVIRRGSLQDIGYLLDDTRKTSTNDLLLGDKKGESVFYFISKFDQKFREGHPWSEQEFFVHQRLLSPSTSLLGLSCPKLRIIPDIGLFFGHSLAALVQLIKIPVNFIMNPFAIWELLEARAKMRCPDNELKHSALENCGMNLLMLTEYFNHMFKANDAFWDIMSWIVFKIVGGNENSELDANALFFSQFLQGAVVLGDATKLIGFFDLTSIPQFLDTGAEQVIFNTGRRRRLLQSDEDDSSSDDSDDSSDGKKSIKNGIGNIFSNIISHFKNIFSNFFSMATDVTSAVTGNVFSGANIGMLISTQDPITSMIAVSVTAPTLAWAQLTYESLLPLSLDILAHAQNGQFSIKPLWVHMYDTLDLYDNIIHERHKRACMGYRLMLGYGSSLGKGIYYNCLAAAEMPRSIWTVLLTIFVDMNLYRCLCVNPQGGDYMTYTHANCDYLISANRKGIWQNILSFNTINEVCVDYASSIERQMYGAFDVWSQYSFSAAESITSFLDETFVYQEHVSDCNNVQSNPTAIVLTPIPVYHFHVCGKTSSCRTRCEDSIMLFEAEYKRVKQSGFTNALQNQNQYNLNIESPFFNKYNNDWSSSGGGYTILQNRNKFIRAIGTQYLKEITDPTAACRMRCENTGSNGLCIRVLTELIDLVTRSYEVQFFCLPSSEFLLASIFNTGIQSFSLTNAETWISQESLKITHVEFSIQKTSTSATYVFMYVTKENTKISIENKINDIDTNEIYLWKSNRIGGATKIKILRSEQIASSILQQGIKRALFGPDVEIIDPEIVSCRILSTIEIFSGVEDLFTIFFSFDVTLKTTLRLNDDSSIDRSNEKNIQSSNEKYLLYGIINFCDKDQETIFCKNDITYFVPCAYCRSKGIAECLSECNENIDVILDMSDQGTFNHMYNQSYMYIPNNRFFNGNDIENDNMDITKEDSNIQFLEIHPSNGKKKTKYKSSFMIDGRHSDTLNYLGSFSRINVFDTSLIINKRVRDCRAYTDSAKTFYFQIDGGIGQTSIASEWLEQVRLKKVSSGYQLLAVKSETTTQTASLLVHCNTSSCYGCGTSRLRLLCHAAQNCILSKCIGSVVQTRNVFCGIGNVFEKMAMHSILTWKAIYMTIAEMVLIAMKGLGGNAIEQISLKFPTDQFYALLCGCKDTFASLVGLGMSLIQMLSSNLFGSSGTVQGLSISGESDEMSILIGEKTLKTKSVGNMFFNMLVGSTLLPTMALHRFLLCAANASLASGIEDGSISIQFEDVAMDNTWLPCTKISGISSIVNSINMLKSLDNSIEMFASFSLSLLSGLGNTILLALQLSFDSILDFFISLVWSLQDILITFNTRACKVPNYALRYVLWCSCQDSAFKILSTHKTHKMNEGALWCVGTMSINLIDGTTNAIIFNPYSLSEIEAGMTNIINYINCISSTGDKTSCNTITRMYDQTLGILVAQNVEPLAVWTKCKKNYLESTWDNGAGAIFMEGVQSSPSNPYLTQITIALKEEWKQWALSISNNFHYCMTEPSRINLDYSSCTRMFFSQKYNQTPNSYFVYEKMDDKSQLPDACHVFTGIANNNQNNTPLKEQFKACVFEQKNIAILDSDIESTSSCEMNPLVWSTGNAQQNPVANFHGTAPPWNGDTTLNQKIEYVQTLYEPVRQRLMKAWQQFNDTFERDASAIEVALFTADGDFIHDFFDCMFLGPYTRVDLLPCDKENILDCPFYARDELGGKSREFTKCFGEEIMFNDSLPPYTCGSRARRSIIKYFYREIISKQKIKMNVSRLIKNEIDFIFKNYTSVNSSGCYDKKTGECSLTACTLSNGFSPCMMTNFFIDGLKVSKFIIDIIFQLLPKYYQDVLQDTQALTLYSNTSGPADNSKTSAYPYQWKKTKETADAALDLNHFSPNLTISSYTASEVFNMPLFNASDIDRRLGSIWSTCMALLAQPSLTIPMEKKGFDENEMHDVPVGLWNILMNASFNSKENSHLINERIDLTDMNVIETMVRNIVKSNINSHSPFAWHKSKRHVPSQSNFCKKKYTILQEDSNPSKIFIEDLVLHYQDEDSIERQIRLNQNEPRHFLHNGFLRYTIGTAHDICVCGFASSVSGSKQCIFEENTCSSILQNTTLLTISNCQILLEACQNDRRYPIHEKQRIFDCLRSINKNVQIPCPEFAPSDTWGFFPVDCDTVECDGAKSWIGLGSSDISYKLIRFLNEGKGGLRISNYVHYNSTYHHAINHNAYLKSPEKFAIENCHELHELQKTEDEENNMNVAKDFVSKLFPVAQVVYESHVIASCSRFIIEIARIQTLESSGIEVLESDLLIVMRWKRKCEAKIRHLSLCSMMGVYFEIPPPTDWENITSESCNVKILNNPNNHTTYMTPWCILIIQEHHKMYDAHLCAKRITGRYPSNTEETSFSPYLDLKNDNLDLLDCELNPNPLSFLATEFTPYSSVLSYNNERLLKEDEWIQELIPGLDLATIYQISQNVNKNDKDYVSQIYDWWPEKILNMPTGYHITSPMDPTDLAPVLFDSHYFYDEREQIAFYVHSSLRNHSLVHEHMGACGICRSPTIGMPMFDANTNRYCTRLSKFSHDDVPTFPVNRIKRAGGDLDNTEFPFSQSFIEQTFYPEFCAEDSTDVPWTEKDYDVISKTAGNIPGWNLFTMTQANENTYYDSYAVEYFPPTSSPEALYQFHDINEDKIFEETSAYREDPWGICADIVHWKGEIECDILDTNFMCPTVDSVCLKIDVNSTKGICFPTITYKASTTNKNGIIRSPCFAGFHCNENEVCLADGGCFPLYFHVWNDNTYSIEFSVIADSCGFQEKQHPYVQNARGASPWEEVDDILHIHGFCSHHDWFSYRHSINIGLCNRDTINGIEMFKCDPNITKWPWIKEKFDKTRPTDSTTKTMLEDRILMMKPNVCDKSIFHLQNPYQKFKDERLKFCSGFQGRQTNIFPNTYFSYSLSEENKAWDNVNLFSSNDSIEQEKSSWMRTFDEEDETKHIGIIGYKPSNNYPLGFLGANISADDVFRQATYGNENSDKFRFFKCRSKLSCTFPQYTFNGVSVMRLDPEDTKKQFSELSLRYCGSIGHYPSIYSFASQRICALDIDLFPLIRSLLWDRKEKGCSIFFGNIETFKLEYNILTMEDSFFDQLTENSMVANKFYCRNNYNISNKNSLCVYRARQSQQLTSTSSSDSIVNSIEMINQMLLSTPTKISNLYSDSKNGLSATRIYESINQCTNDILNIQRQSQSTIQSAYKTRGTSGLYYALKLSLFEIPLDLIHHIWLLSLLSKIDTRFNLPSISNIIIDGSGNVLLWNKKMSFCNTEELSMRSMLLTFICQRMHLDYTFWEDKSSLLETYTANLIKRVRTDIETKLQYSRSNIKVKCFERAKWNCRKLSYNKRQECENTQAYMHKTLAMENEDDECSTFIRDLGYFQQTNITNMYTMCKEKSTNYEYLNPCETTNGFDYENEMDLPNEYIDMIGGSGSSLSDLLNNANTLLKTILTNKVNQIIEEIDYVEATPREVLNEKGQITIFKISSLYNQISKDPSQLYNLNFSNWFKEEVCPSKFPLEPKYLCKWQETISDSNPCLYPYETPENELYRFAYDEPTVLYNNKNMIKILYDNNVKEYDYIDICDIIPSNNPDNEVCITQYLGDSNFTSYDAITSCDIKAIYAPSGIEIQAFATKRSPEEWNSINNDYSATTSSGVKYNPTKSMCTPTNDIEINRIKQCTWKYDASAMTKPTMENAWWYGEKPTIGNQEERISTDSYMKRGHHLEIELSEMKDWWRGSEEWQEDGCYEFRGACSLKLKFEFKKGFSRALCSNTHAMPNCANLVSDSYDYKSRAFKVARNTVGATIWRCAPCTKKENYISKDGLFGCHIQDVNGQKIDSIEQTLNRESISNYLSYLENKDLLAQVMVDSDSSIKYNNININNQNIIQVVVPMEPTNPISENSIKMWKRFNSQEICNGEYTTCFDTYSIIITSTLRMDELIWNEAISNPYKSQTMICTSQNMEYADFYKCNPKIDKRREMLREFTDVMYRKRNGLWMQKVMPDKAASWQANVAHPDVNMFSLVFADTDRDIRQVISKYILSKEICASQNSNLEDRICIEAIEDGNIPFQPIHPWIGGDFNPFEGKRGMDECHVQSIITSSIDDTAIASTTLLKSICECTCSPESNCKDPKNIYNYSDTQKRLEFPSDEKQCIIRTYPSARIMDDNDESNICYYGKQKSTLYPQCLHHQGILGGSKKTPPTITVDELHSKSGVKTSQSDFLIQTLYDYYDDEDSLLIEKQHLNGLWMGNTLLEESINNTELYSFLKMSRNLIQPAHIAFSIDRSKIGYPLIVKAIGLLPYNGNETAGVFPSPLTNTKTWIKNLKKDWNADVLKAQSIYPFLHMKSTIDKRVHGHWSCPLKIISFWGNAKRDSFSPHVPNPLLSKVMYRHLHGAHPLVNLKPVHSKLKKYKTTNGGCFYEYNSDNQNTNFIPLHNTKHPCGLVQMLRNLNDNSYSLSQILNHFQGRCQDIIDFPGLNVTLRNGETIHEPLQVSDQNTCGVLHRITPHLFRIKGNAATIKTNQNKLTTSSEGGDCHMGRSFKYSYRERSNVVGKKCSLFEKDNKRGVIRCIGLGNRNQMINIDRSTPKSLQDIIDKKLRLLKSEIIQNKKTITFKGPGNLQTNGDIPNEVSFGFHMSVSLARTLAEDLVFQCKNQQSKKCLLLDVANNDKWSGGRNFINNYQSQINSLVQIENTPSTTTLSENIKKIREIIFKGIVHNKNDSLSAILVAKNKDNELWNTPNWTWSFYQLPTSIQNTTQTSNQSTPPSFIRNYTGTVNKTLWKKDRFQACKQSHDYYFDNEHSPIERIMDYNTMSISLCEPAPTGSLQEFCKELLTFKQSIQLINCQVMGNNDCLYSPGMFYVPYAWSTSNQEFSAQTVNSYYRDIISSKFKNESFEVACPSNSDLDANLIRLSKETKERCPASKVEYLKETFETIKTIGEDLLYMGYCVAMFIVNAISVIFTKSGEATNASMSVAVYYIEQFISTGRNIIMPILNAFVNIIFGTSSLGSIIHSVLMALCKIYNWLMTNIIIHLWCRVIMPILDILIRILKVVIGSFSSEINAVLDTLWNALSGGNSGFNVAACIGRMQPNLVCDVMPNVVDYNATGFETQPFASLCWVDSASKISGGSVFTGSSEFSYLSCTPSDTCALDPIQFDKNLPNSLVPCGSCPKMDYTTGKNGKVFGCNAYIKRCTCSVDVTTISPCMSNSDCLQQSTGPICSISSTIDSVRNSYSSLPCSECGSLSLSPVCVLDGMDQTGVCSCASINHVNFLASCSNIGSNMGLLDVTKQCFVSTNPDILSIENVNLNIDFKDLSIASCSLGTIQYNSNLCVLVTLPMQSGLSSLTKPYIVIRNANKNANVNTISGVASLQLRRRLLSVSNTTVALSPTQQSIMNDTLQNFYWASQCEKKHKRGNIRNDIKLCIQWNKVNSAIENIINVSFLDPWYSMLPDYNFHVKFWSNRMTRNLFLETHNGLLSTILQTVSNSIEDGYSEYKEFQKTTKRKGTPINNITILSTHIKTCSISNTCTNNGTKRRHLLQINTDSQQGMNLLRLPPENCDAIQKPLRNINEAFWTTMTYYAKEKFNLSKNNDYNLVWYNFPPLDKPNTNVNVSSGNSISSIIFSGINYLLSWTLTGGKASGEQIINSFVTNMSYKESVDKNYFTGNRFLNDLSVCNYTTLTNGPNPQRNLMSWFLMISLAMIILTNSCCTSMLLSWILWFIIFPMTLFWTVYNSSPLCFPMIPPKLPHDVKIEISKMLPTDIKIPYFLANVECLKYKEVTMGNQTKLFPMRNGLYESLTTKTTTECFKKCKDDPFLMKSWQDPLAWWMCEISKDTCRYAASWSLQFPVINDFASSAKYFAKVLEIEDIDSEFTHAHRLCAIFNTHELLISIIVLIFAFLIFPTIIQAIIEIAAAAIILVFQGSYTENVDD